MYAFLARSPAQLRPPSSAGSLVRPLAFGFAYWFAIVAVLEPGNWLNMVAAGETPRLDQELLRLVCAGLLGSISAPIALALSRRFPVAVPHQIRDLTIHGACAITLATGLIIVAHPLAGWILSHTHRPLRGYATISRRTKPCCSPGCLV